VPSRIELVSLVDFTRSRPAADVAFSQTPITAPYYFWTSSPSTFAPNSVWVVNFSGGTSLAAVATTPLYLRCVR
jgi:Protein of unknown function (DUF1566)